MAKLPNTFRWRDMSGGVTQKISPDIKIPNTVPFSINLLYDKVIGEAVSRKGTNIVGVAVGGANNCTGLFQHIDSTFANSKLFAGYNGSIFDVLAGSSSLSSLTANSKMRFCTFLNTTLMLNGVEARSYDSSNGWLSTGGALDVGNVPAGAQYPIEYKDRMYCAVKDQLYYTTTPISPDMTTVSWTAAGSGSLQVEQQDGGGTIQGLNKVPGYLMIYKQRSLKRWNFDSSFPEDLVNIGTQSNESIVRARGKNFFFYGPNGFYQTDGGYPTLLSRPIQRFVEGISPSFFSQVNGWSDNLDVYWSVGDITIDFDRGYKETYTNCVLRYNIDMQQWAPLRYSSHSFKFMGQYVDSYGASRIVGGDVGRVIQLNTGNTDYQNVPITYILQCPEFDFGTVLRLTGAFINQREVFKTLSEKIFIHSDRTTGAELLTRLDYGPWTSIGKLGDIVTELEIKKVLTAHVFEFRVSDSITGEQIKIRGLDFPTIDVLKNSK